MTSELGKGSTFSVILPVVYRNPKAPEPDTTSESDPPTVRLAHVPAAIDQEDAHPPGLGPRRPSPEQVEGLCDAARRGRILTLRHEIDEIERQHKELAEFASRLRYHADRFELDQICDLLIPAPETS